MDNNDMNCRYFDLDAMNEEKGKQRQSFYLNLKTTTTVANLR
jgi:hypothetical protein